MNPRASAVVPTPDHKLEITFTSGEVGVYDCSPLLEFGIFRELQDIRYFQQASVAGGTVVWPFTCSTCVKQPVTGHPLRIVDPLGKPDCLSRDRVIPRRGIDVNMARRVASDAPPTRA